MISTLTQFSLKPEFAYPHRSDAFTTATTDFASAQLATGECSAVWVGRAEDSDEEKRAVLLFIMNWDTLKAERRAQASESPSLVAAVTALESLLCVSPSIPSKSAYEISPETLDSLLSTPTHPILEIFQFQLAPSRMSPTGTDPRELTVMSPAQEFVDQVNRKTDSCATLVVDKRDENKAAIVICWRSIVEHETVKRENAWFRDALEKCGGEDGWRPLQLVHVEFRKV